MDISINQVRVNELQNFLNNNNVLLVDVRAEREHLEHNIGGVNIPFNKISTNILKFSTANKILLYCNHGEESFFAAQLLKLKHNITNVYNLQGGISVLKAI